MNTVLRSVCRSSGLLKRACRIPRPAVIPQCHHLTTQFRCLSGDPSLLSALNNEILHEEGGDDSVDVKTSDIQIGDFVKSVEGATIMLTKRQGDETIRVELNVNHMTELAPAEDDPEETPPQYLPSFKIEVTKPQGKLVFNCNYHMAAEAQLENTEQYVISEVSYVSPGLNEEIAFTTDFGNLDYTLIEEFEKYLSRRGLGSDFSVALFEMSSAFEHHNYVQFLKNVRDFVN